MWVIRILTGAQAGHIFGLAEGRNIIGRAPSCTIKILSPNVSKEHLQIDVLDDKVIAQDLGSTNGTFVNGVKIKSQRLKAGDRLSLHDIVFDVQSLSPEQAAYLQSRARRTVAAQDPQTPLPEPAAAPMGQESLGLEAAPSQLKSLVGMARLYLNNVVLPGIYKLPETFDFKWVLAGFVGAFILFVTAFSSIPLMRILKASIEKESQRRALTIARTLERVNRPALMAGQDSGVSVDIALREPGVDKAMIISNVDGNIIAPASQAGSYPNNSFIYEARKNGKEDVRQLDSGTIGAIVPIKFFNAETGTEATTAYAVVIYNMGSLAVDDGRTLSLFIQTFFIALIVGSILFFFMYKICEYPFVSLNQQLDRALKEGLHDISLKFLFPELQNLVSNINSALTRVASASFASQSQQRMEHDRNFEMSNLVELMGFAAIAINGIDLKVHAVNAAFESRTGLNISGMSIDAITDQALKLSLSDLIERAKATPDQVISNDLEFSGHNFQLAAQAVFGSDKVAYFLIVLLPAEAGGVAA